MSTIRIFCLSRAVTPITHAAGTEGNESVIARTPVMFEGALRRVPYLSGNSLRSYCVRRPGVRWLIEQYGLAGKLSLPQLNFLLHGGALTESTGRGNVARIAELHAAWPLLKAIGGCLPDQILAGSMLGCPGVLVCEETRATVQTLLPDGYALPEESLLSAEAFVQQYQYVTYDAADREPELLPKTVSGDEKSRGSSDIRMLYTGQAVAPGALFAHDFMVRYARDEDAGAVLWSLSLWQAASGVVGGMGAKGHGRLATQIVVSGTDRTVEDLVGAYVASAGAMKERALAWLEAAFAVKGPRGRKAKAEPAEAAT